MLIARLAICSYLASIINESKADPSWSNCTYIVTPDGKCPNSSEPLHNASCNTLDTYIQNASAYFVSNTTFCFMSGRHIMNVMVTIRSISNISFIGFGTAVQNSVYYKAKQFNFSDLFPKDDRPFLEPAAIIECKNHSGFHYYDINHLSLTNLTIVKCGANVNESTLSFINVQNTIDNTSLSHYVAVLMVNVSNLRIEATSIQNSTGYGLMGVNILGQSQITRSSFVGNNQLVKDNLEQHDIVNTYCGDEFYNITPRFYVNHAGADTYVGGNALFIYVAQARYSIEPVLEISFCLFTLGVDGSMQSKEQDYYTSYYKSMGTGLGIILLQTSYQVHVTITNTVTYRNQASYGGNLNFQVHPLTFDITLSNVYSVKGRSEYGGTLYFTIISSLPSDVKNPDNLKVSDSKFSTDYAVANGIYITMSNWSFPMHFEHCNVYVSWVLKSSQLQVATRVTVIFSNTVFSAPGCSGGIAAYCISMRVTNCIFRNYTNIYGSKSYIYVADSTFANTTFSALVLEDSGLSLTGEVSFMNIVGKNSATNNVLQGNGAALYLSYSVLTLIAPANISFTNNRASQRGGAIFIRKKFHTEECNIVINDTNGTLENPGVHLSFQGNHANEAGDVLYGGDIDTCTYDCKLAPHYCSSGRDMLAVFNATTSCGNTICGNTASNLTMISSDPRTICSCTNNTIDCKSKTGGKDVYPGQTIHIPIVTVGQLDGISPDTIVTFTCNVNSCIPGNQYQTMWYCSNYSYLVKGKDNFHIEMWSKAAYVDGYGTSKYSMSVTVLSCPNANGFIWDQTEQICSCSPILQKNGVQCCINTLTVTKPGTLWIGKSSSGELAVHTHCPYNHCKVNKTLLSLSKQDEQCDYNHSGVLCGGCKVNFSAVFGSPRCILCTNWYLIQLVPFAISGVVLVVLLFLFNCTVTMGTINCLILYANVVGPSILHIMPHNDNGGYFKKFLFVFIDWLNLDLGIETCFYDGMDTYAKTWLELLFPLWIFFLVGIIIIVSRCSSKVAQISKRNAVPVLATLILLLYTNFLQCVIEIFSYTQLDTEQSNLQVWLVDGNVLFAKGRHIYLFIAGFIISAFFFLYTLLLLFSPFLQARTHTRLFNWVNRLKPFIDANQAPFKDQYRFWPGVHLMIRVVLYAVFTTNLANDINVNLFATAIVACIYCGMTNIFSVYKNWILNIMETFFIINLLCLSTSMLYIHNYTDETNDIPIMIIVGSVFIVFFAIAVFHCYTSVSDLIASKRGSSNNQMVLPDQQDAAEALPLVTSTRITRDSIIFDTSI